MFKEIFHLLWKTNEWQVNLSFLLLRVSSSQLSARGMGGISGKTLATKSKFPCNRFPALAPDGISTHSEFLSLSHHPRGSIGIVTRCFWQKFFRRIPTPSILLGKVERSAKCLLMQKVRLEIASSSVPMPV